LKGSRYLVTGGAGFIGSHLVDRLMQEGATVTVFDNLSSGREEFLSAHFSNERFHFFRGDVLDLDMLRQVMKGHDVVFHFAANPDVRRGIRHTDLDLKLEAVATYNVLEAMRLTGVSRIVFSSSGTVYGETPVVPLCEDYGPLLPISLYGAGKLASEGLISAFSHIFGMRAWIFRLANVVGPRATHGVIYDFVAKLRQDSSKLVILGDGSQSKPYVHVCDCIDGILYGFRNSCERINLFNLSTDSVIDVSSIARIVLDEMGLSGVNLIYTGGDRGWPGDVPRVVLDVTKLARLGWVASLTSEEAVRKAVRELVRGVGQVDPRVSATEDR